VQATLPRLGENSMSWPSGSTMAAPGRLPTADSSAASRAGSVLARGLRIE
jgi:hypothetical protein